MYIDYASKYFVNKVPTFELHGFDSRYQAGSNSFCMYNEYIKKKVL